MARMSDLPEDLVVEILSRVPLASLRTVRSTCKTWNVLSKSQIFCGKSSAARKQFLGLMMTGSRVCSFRFDPKSFLLNKGDMFDSSITPTGKLEKVIVSKVFHCNGILLCTMRNKCGKLLVWNPYLGQVRWVQLPKSEFIGFDLFALRWVQLPKSEFIDCFGHRKSCPQDFIYDFNSDSWRLLDFKREFAIAFERCCVTLKGNTYFVAHDTKIPSEDGYFLLCFDFTTERFGPPLPLPFSFGPNSLASLSCVRAEQLVVLKQDYGFQTLEIWITTKIEHNTVSWSKFLKVGIASMINEFPDDLYADFTNGSFFVDEENRLLVVTGLCIRRSTETGCYYYTAHVLGENRYHTSVKFVGDSKTGSLSQLQFSSYVPSLVQL